MSSRLPWRSATATILLAGIAMAQMPTRIAQPLAELNLLGFDAAGSKTIVLPKPNSGNWWAGSWRLVTYPQGTLVARGQFPQPKAWSGMGTDQYMLVELPDTLKSGTYILLDSAVSNGTRLSEPFTVRHGAYHDLVKASIKAFYYQRSSMELTEQYAGVWKRAAGHPDLQVTIFNDPQGRKWDSPRGWYDAGDYGLYVVNAGISTWSLMHIAEILPKYVDTLKWNIPPADGGMPANLPDLLNEIKWETDWLLSMQDVDGGVWNKLTTWKHAATVMPSEDRGERFNVPKSTDATLNFVAVLAQAARVFKPYSTTYTAKCSTAAAKGWEWTKRNPGVLFPRTLCRNGSTSCTSSSPDYLGTGWYDVSNTSDLVQPRTWAATEMSLLTGRPADYFTAQERAGWEASMSKYGIPGWYSMGMLGEFQMMTRPELFTQTGMMTLANTSKNAVKASADAAKAMIASNGYGVPLDNRSFYWGSNSGVANNGMALLYTFRATGDSSYLRAAQHTLDYLLGRNPIRKSFVTGFPPGTAENPVQRYPMHPHHRPSEKDGVVEPVPGMLSGGPNSSFANDCATNFTNAAKPALSWIDDYCSYASNEIAINWNAPLFNLAAQLDAIYAEKAARQGGSTSIPSRPASLPVARIIGSRLLLPAGGALRIALHDPAGRQLATFAVPASAVARELMLPTRPGLSLVVVRDAQGAQVLRTASTR